MQNLNRVAAAHVSEDLFVLHMISCCKHAEGLGTNIHLRFQNVGGARRCKTLDASADGYVRSEACCVMLLAAADPAALVLAGSAVNQDGRSAHTRCSASLHQLFGGLSSLTEHGQYMHSLLPEPADRCF